MNDRRLLRIGGFAAVTGALAQFVATVLEPDWGGAPDKAAEVVAGNAFWTGDRLLDVIGVLLTLAALTLVGRTLGEGGADWARFGQPFLVLMAALGASATVVGANLKHLANAWIAAGPDAGRSYLTAFDATARVTEALFFGAFLALGLYLATLAVAILSGRTYARWIGWAAAVSAVLVLAGDLLELVVATAFAAVLVGFVLFLAVLIALGVSLWRRAQVNRRQLPRRRRLDRTTEDQTWGVRMMFRLAFLATAAWFLLGSVATPAVAAPSGLGLDPAIGPPTSLVKAKGSGFAGREVVALYFDGVRVGSDTTGPSGKFNTRVTIPALAQPGDHSVEAVGQSSGASARAAFLVRTDWLQGCFEAGRSCFNPYENVLDPGNVGALSAVWRAHIGAGGSSAPVYANGKLFVGTENGLVALDPATGAIIINYRSGPVSTTPAVIRGFDPQPDPPGKVIFGSRDGILHAVSTAGGQLWQADLGGVPSSPLVIQGVGDPNIRVVVGAGNTLFAFDGNGNRLWATVLDGGNISTPAALLVGDPNQRRVIVAAGSTLYALDDVTGALIWASTPSRSPLGAPSIGNPNILVGDQAGMLFSLDPAMGTVKSSLATRGPITSSPAIGDPNVTDPWVVAGDGGGNIYAIDQTDDFPPPIWQAALGGPVDGPPVLANGVVYAATDPESGDPHMVALDQASGRVLFDATLAGGAAGGPIVADGRLVVATRSGDIVAYQGPDS